MESGGERLRYTEAHWSRHENEEAALDQYLRLAEKVFNRTAIKLLLHLSGNVQKKRVLDYGGGAGIMAVLYAKAGADVVLVDAEASALRTARFYATRAGASERIHTIQSDCFPTSLRDECFDVIIAKDIIEHIEDDYECLLNMSACQQRGGLLVLSTQNSWSLNRFLEGNYQKYWCGNKEWCGWDQTHLRFYTPLSLKRKLNKAGYRVNRWASVYLIPYNIGSWACLLRRDLEIPALHYCDLTLGRMFPFNRLGWNIIARAVRM